MATSGPGMCREATRATTAMHPNRKAEATRVATACRVWAGVLWLGWAAAKTVGARI